MSKYTIKSDEGADFATCAIAIVAIVFIAIIALLIGPVLLMWAWNAFMPSVFGLAAIDFWQAFAAVVLLWFLGGVFRGRNKAD